MNAARRVSAAGVAAAGGAGIGVGGMLLVVLLVVLSVMAAIAISVLSVAFAVLTVLVQGLFAAVVFGGVAAAITYGIKRSKTPDARFQFEKPAASVPARERAAAAYRGLDPVTQSAVKVGAIAAATGFLLSVLF